MLILIRVQRKRTDRKHLLLDTSWLIAGQLVVNPTIPSSASSNSATTAQRFGHTSRFGRCVGRGRRRFVKLIVCWQKSNKLQKTAIGNVVIVN